MEISGIDDAQTREKIDRIFEEMDEKRTTNYKQFYKKYNIAFLISGIFFVLLLLFGGSMIDVFGIQVWVWLIIILSLVIGCIVAYYKWKTYHSYSTGWFEYAKVVRDYQVSSGKKVKVHLPMRLYAFAVIGILAGVFLVYFALQSDDPTDYYGVIGGLILSAVIIGGFFLWYKLPFWKKSLNREQ